MSKHLLPQIEDYEPLIGGDALERIREKARKLQGLRVANFNSTYYGGGGAEVISSLQPVMNNLGLRSRGRVLEGETEFFFPTTAMYNSPLGGQIGCSKFKQEHF